MTTETTNPKTNYGFIIRDLLNKRDEIGKRVPLSDKDLAEIRSINHKLGVPQ